MREAADKLYEELKTAGVDVILDDRDIRAGVMFADWELIGVPHRLVVGERGLKTGDVEYVERTKMDEKQMLKVTEAAQTIAAKVTAAKAH